MIILAADTEMLKFLLEQSDSLIGVTLNTQIAASQAENSMVTAELCSIELDNLKK